MGTITQSSCLGHLAEKKSGKENSGDKDREENLGDSVSAVIGNLRVKAAHRLFYDWIACFLPRLDTALNILDIGKTGFHQHIGCGD